MKGFTFKMRKGTRDIKIIIISIFIILLLFIVTIIMFNDSKNSSKTIIITELNEEYNGKINVVATDIKTIKVLDGNKEIYYVGARFEVYNNSNITFDVRSTQISTYVDDVSLYSIDFAEKYFDKNNENLFAGNLAPGKKTMGYEVAEVQSDSKTVEFIFDNPDYGDVIKFVFDIPKVTESINSYSLND